ncbi:hypothetical protein cyc_03778 [Cyclospora cayetanensis]|uniref:Uncharacterized protein n=1 Tax=Cyclospora cayetanensis TaxID=88456 RepID=A0A1D3D1L3_9EIME|nr:hypothetical protein cyc_03778 [Cyclospora cayetanensis]
MPADTPSSAARGLVGINAVAPGKTPIRGHGTWGQLPYPCRKCSAKGAKPQASGVYGGLRYSWARCDPATKVPPESESALAKLSSGDAGGVPRPRRPFSLASGTKESFSREAKISSTRRSSSKPTPRGRVLRTSGASGILKESITGDLGIPEIKAKGLTKKARKQKGRRDVAPSPVVSSPMEDITGLAFTQKNPEDTLKEGPPTPALPLATSDPEDNLVHLLQGQNELLARETAILRRALLNYISKDELLTLLAGTPDRSTANTAPTPAQTGGPHTTASRLQAAVPSLTDESLSVCELGPPAPEEASSLARATKSSGELYEDTVHEHETGSSSSATVRASKGALYSIPPNYDVRAAEGPFRLPVTVPLTALLPQSPYAVPCILPLTAFNGDPVWMVQRLRGALYKALHDAPNPEEALTGLWGVWEEYLRQLVALKQRVDVAYAFYKKQTERQQDLGSG